MKNKNVRGILALVLVTALSFGVIIGSKHLATSMGTEQNTGTTAADAKVLEELDVAGAEGIEKAVETETGYMVTVRTKGYGGDIVMNVSFDEEAKNVTGAQVVEHSETEGLGALIAETEFLSQFEGITAPVFLPGMSLGAAPAQESKTEANPAVDTAALTLNDGTYTVNTTEADQNGFTEEMTMVVEGGKITSVVWDCVDADGNRKSVLSENGQYTMTEDGPTWKEQADSLAAALVENQSLNVFTMDEQGKTDAVSGVSISIGGFVSLAEQCMQEAAGTKTAALNDGTYEAKAADFDKSGYMDVMTMTVKDGKITEVVWDNVDANGNKKSVLSQNGEYAMTEDGPIWKEQAESLAAELVAKQSLDTFAMDEQGKTDAVSGVSISIGGFVAMAEDCLAQAAGEAAEKTESETKVAETEAAETAAPQNGTQVDAVSGATISSTAAVTGINKAYEFLQAAK